MFSNNYSIFANPCFKTPLSSSTKLSNSLYPRPKNKCTTKSSNLKKHKNKEYSSCLSLTAENNNFLSLKDFYESIPDYNDVHHLSQCDFYLELDKLKEKQNQLRSSCIPIPNQYDEGVWNKIDVPDLNDVVSKSALEMGKAYFQFKPDDPTKKRSSSAKSVRIETINQPYITPYDDNSTRVFKKSLRSSSTSPKIRSTSRLSKPRKRDEDDEIKTLFSSSSQLNDTCKVENSKVHSIPITSKIPLFSKIMEDKEHKSQLAKLDSAIELNAQIRPFGFDNGPNRPRSRCLSRSLSSPNISSSHEKQFKFLEAQSNIPNSEKLLDDAYFRCMSRRIRAEELYKMSETPLSSMKQNENHKINVGAGTALKKSKKKRKQGRKQTLSKMKNNPFRTDASVSNISDNFNLSITKPSTPSTTLTNGGSSSYKHLAPKPLYPVNRPNLAATLRFEHSRNKIKELGERAESSLSAPLKVFRWGVKKTPGWQSLSYDPTHKEELKLRLATRKAEQKLRNEEFKMTKELMIQRVRAAPLLLEGPTKWGPKVGQLSHHCGNEKDSKDFRGSSKRRVSSKLSNYTDSRMSEKCCNYIEVYDSSEFEEQ